MRYENVLEVTFDVNEAIYQYNIPKLVLQPIIENAIYHGIKPKMQKGHIHISANIEGDRLCFKIIDNGIGMTPEQLKYIQEPYIEENTQSFGLRSTWKRLSIYYECKQLIKVESTPNQGTTVVLRLPLRENIHDSIDI